MPLKLPKKKRLIDAMFLQILLYSIYINIIDFGVFTMKYSVMDCLYSSAPKRGPI